jgi:hypothetical protein
MRVVGLLLALVALTLAGCSQDGARSSSDPITVPPGAATAGTSGATSGSGGVATPTSTAGATSSGTAPRAGATAVAGKGGAAGTTSAAGASGAAGNTSAAGQPVAGNGSGGTSGANNPTQNSGGRGGAPAAGSGGAAGRANGGGSPAAGSGSSMPGAMPVFHIPLRVHLQASELTNAELGPILAELNQIWLTQAGVCFEIEVTDSETNRTDGFDFRYTAGQIPGASGANGVTQSAHSIWSIDHPRLNAVKMPVMNPAARTTAHELGHALGLAHENPPPSTDCASPCYCAQRGDDCDEYLLRSGSQGFFLSPPEIEIARGRAARVAPPSRAEPQCDEPVFMR